MEKPELQPVTKALKEQGVIFDFVTEYSQNRDSIASHREFEVTNEIYEDFISFVENRDFSFETATEKQLGRFEKSLEAEAYDEDLSAEITALQENLNQQKGLDLRTRKDQILPLIKKEIINRYYYKQGVLEAAFDDDPDIKAAIKVLNEPDRYQKILTSGN